MGNQVVSEGLGYLLIMPSCDVDSDTETPVTWTGKKATVNPTMDTAIGLADIQVMQDDGGFSLIYQNLLVPLGRTRIWAHLKSEGPVWKRV